MPGKSSAEMQKMMIQRAANYREAQMKHLRELKKKVTEAEKAHAEIAKLQKEILSAHVKATKEMHRSIRGIPRKKTEKQ